MLISKEKGLNANISYKCYIFLISQILEGKRREERGYKTIRLTQCEKLKDWETKKG